MSVRKYRTVGSLFDLVEPANPLQTSLLCRLKTLPLYKIVELEDQDFIVATEELENRCFIIPFKASSTSDNVLICMTPVCDEFEHE